MKEHVVIEVLLNNLDRFVSSDNCTLDLASNGFKGNFYLNRHDEWIFSLEDLPDRIVCSEKVGLKKCLRTHQLIYQLEQSSEAGCLYNLYFRTLSGKVYRATYIREANSVGIGRLKMVKDV